MAQGTPDIRVLVGVEGASIDGESGKQIAKELEKIAKEISTQKTPQVAFTVDAEKTTKNIQAQLNEIVKGIQISPINLSIRTSQTSTGSLVEDEYRKLFDSVSGKKAKANIIAHVEEKRALADLSVQRQKDINLTEKQTKTEQERAKAAKSAEKAILDNATKTASTKSTYADFQKYLTTVKTSAMELKQLEIQNIYKNLDAGNLKEAQIAIKSLKADFRSLGAEGGNVFTYLGEKMKTFSVYLMSSGLTMAAVSSMRKAIDLTFDLNEALVDLQIVTGGNQKQAGELLKTYNQMAMELGSTTKAISSGANDWLRQGYSIAETNELLKDSMVLSIVGDMGSAEATEALTAAMKGYGLSINEVMGVVDKFTRVDLDAATSSSALAIALSKTAANAKLAGLSLNDVIGQLAVVNETMKEAPESTGTFYNTMLSRMGMLKAGRLEDPETGDSLSDVETTLTRLGIVLRSSEGEFRNFGDVLDEVGQKWGAYGSVNQRAIAQAFAGTRQQTRFLSLMQGWSKAAEYSEAAANSAGTAMEKFGAYQEGLEYKTQRNTAAFEHLTTVLLDSGLVGGVVDLGTGLLQLGAAGDGLPAKFVLTTTAALSLSSALKALSISSIGKSFGTKAKDLGEPKMTGFEYQRYCA